MILLEYDIVICLEIINMPLYHLCDVGPSCTAPLALPFLTILDGSGLKELNSWWLIILGEAWRIVKMQSLAHGRQ